MKKKTAILTITIALIFALSGCTGGFFGKLNFGMSREEAKKAESTLGEPTTVFDDESYLYREYVLYNTGGDLILSFDENNTLDRITYYAYTEYATDEIYADFVTQLQDAYPGAADASASTWTVPDKETAITLQYASGAYLLVTFEPNAD